MEQQIGQRTREVRAVLCSLYHTVVTKKELSQKAKLLIYQSIFVSTLMS